MNRLISFLFLGVFLVGCSQTAAIRTTSGVAPTDDLPNSGRKMELRGYAFPPPAFHAFCASEPRLCGTRGATKIVALTPARMDELRSVNVSVNKRIAELSDKRAVGKLDDWALPSSVGDCEDFAILKKHELMSRGWPASALLLTVVTSGGEGHVVLTVRTDRGDLILDNWTSAIKDWERVPYRFFARQSQTSHGKWDRIGSSRTS